MDRVSFLQYVELLNVMNKINHQILCILLDYIQGVSRLVDITARGDFLGLCDQKAHLTCVRFWTVTEL